MADGLKPKTPYLRNMLWAFFNWWVHLRDWPGDFGNFVGCWDDKAGSNHCHFSNIIFFGSLLTGLGVYDKIGKHAGAGSIVPISGFANSVVSPAMEWQQEGIHWWFGSQNVYIGWVCDCLWYLRFYCIGANKISLAPYNRRSLMNQKNRSAFTQSPRLYCGRGSYCRAKKKKKGL